MKKQNNRGIKQFRTAYAKDHKADADDSEVFRTVVDSPLSSFAEAIRSIKLTIDLHMDARPCKVIGFTSTLPNEGKSTIAAALAYLIAQVGGRVLLVDCDLRNPTLSRMLAREAAVGIFDVVSKRTSIAEAILKEPQIQYGIFASREKNTAVSHERGPWRRIDQQAVRSVAPKL